MKTATNHFLILLKSGVEFFPGCNSWIQACFCSCMKAKHPGAWIRKIILLSTASSTIVAVSGQTVWTGISTVDAFVRTASPASNYGAAGALMVAGSASGIGAFESLVKFNLSGAKTQFDTQYGSGNWTISAVTLRLAGNVSTQGGTSSNFPAINAGNFTVTWTANDTWTEGAGTPAAPGASGVSFNDLTSLGGISDLSLGTFSFTPPGNNVAITWTLPAMPSSFTADLAAGGDVSLLFAPGDTTVAYLFNSRSYGTSANRPLLSVTAVPEPSAASFIMAAAGLFVWMKTRNQLV